MLCRYSLSRRKGRSERCLYSYLTHPSTQPINFFILISVFSSNLLEVSMYQYVNEQKSLKKLAQIKFLLYFCIVLKEFRCKGKSNSSNCKTKSKQNYFKLFCFNVLYVSKTKTKGLLTNKNVFLRFIFEQKCKVVFRIVR